MASIVVLDDATARAQLDQLDVLNNGDIRIVDGATVIATFALPADAMGAASGTGVGTRSIQFLSEPYTATAAAATTDNGTELVAQFRNSSGTVIFTSEAMVTGGDAVVIIAAPAHSGNTSKPNIASGQDLEIQIGAQITY